MLLAPQRNKENRGIKSISNLLKSMHNKIDNVF